MESGLLHHYTRMALFNFLQQQSDTHDLLVDADSLLEQTLHTGRLYREVDYLLPCFREGIQEQIFEPLTA